MNLIKKAEETSEQPPIVALLSPFQQFIQNETSGGFLLLSATLFALIWANSPYQTHYVELWEIPLTVGIGNYHLEKSILHWINDGLMAVFFFVVGLEIKREFLVGELSEPHQATLPIAAALGGMIIPAGLYLVLNSNDEGEMGWGIPMATDIAFALGVLALLGKAIPLSLKVFLVALAIVDDLATVLIIALFYSSEISLPNLAIGGATLALLVLSNFLGIRHPMVYGIVGIGGVWFAFLLSGIHATIAGVLVALTIPARPRIGREEFVQKIGHFLKIFKQIGTPGPSVLANEKQSEVAEAVRVSGELVQTPLQRLEHHLQPWVSFAIMPLFALANAGIPFAHDIGASLVQPISLGIFAGLLLGKPIGITVASWIAVQGGLGKLPAGVGWLHIFGIGCLGGVGFTMSIFITNLAFREDPLLHSAKAAILVASLIAGIIGWSILRMHKPNIQHRKQATARSS